MNNNYLSLLFHQPAIIGKLAILLIRSGKVVKHYHTSRISGKVSFHKLVPGKYTVRICDKTDRYDVLMEIKVNTNHTQNITT